MSKPPRYSVPKHSPYSSYPVVRRPSSLQRRGPRAGKAPFLKRCATRLFNFVTRQKTSVPVSNQSRRQKKREFVSAGDTDRSQTRWVAVFGVMFGILVVVVKFLTAPLFKTLSWLGKQIDRRAKRTDFFRAAFACAFLVITLKFATLQVFPENNFFESTIFQTSQRGSKFTPSIIPAERGQIFIRDDSQNRNDIAVTQNHNLSNVFFDPSQLQQQIAIGELTLEEATRMVSAALNLEYSEVYEKFELELSRDELQKFAYLEKFVSKPQRDAVEYLRFPPKDEETGNFVQPPLANWLGHETQIVRSYPENRLLANTLGFVPRHSENKAEVLKRPGCVELVNNNEARGTEGSGYVFGSFGLEEQYCTELGGLNGLSLFSQEVGTETEAERKVVHGSDLFLTIDINIQRKAEEVLAQAVKDSTNKLRGPKDGAAIVMEVETGRIVALASYPTFDPNEYQSILDPKNFGNAATAGGYEVGSVMKPLTVAATLNEHQLGKVDSAGQRIGTEPAWTFEDYGPEGKEYENSDGTIDRIQNSNGVSYEGQGGIGLSQILRDSINTGIAEIIPTIGNSTLQDYFLNRYKVSAPTYLRLPGSVPGDNSNSLEAEANLYSPFVYANYGFGQGFYMSPVQLLRAYTPLANDGVMVEPYLVEEIRAADGELQSLPTPRPDPVQVLEPSTADLVTGYLVDTIDQGYLGKRPSKGQVPGYSIAGKTGTAEVGRKPEISCGAGTNVYMCNRQRGIYDHTFVGYGPEKDPKYMILMKLTEPDPGNLQNFADNTLGPGFSELMKYTLEYNGIAPDKEIIEADGTVQ